jgi:hypothetical protein
MVFSHLKRSLRISLFVSKLNSFFCKKEWVKLQNFDGDYDLDRYQNLLEGVDYRSRRGGRQPKKSLLTLLDLLPQDEDVRNLKTTISKRSFEDDPPRFSLQDA